MINLSKLWGTPQSEQPAQKPEPATHMSCSRCGSQTAECKSSLESQQQLCWLGEHYADLMPAERGVIGGIHNATLKQEITVEQARAIHEVYELVQSRKS